MEPWAGCPYPPWCVPQYFLNDPVERHYRELAEATAALLMDTHKENRRLKEAIEAADLALWVAEGKLASAEKALHL